MREIDVDEFANEQLSELERRDQLESAGRLGAEIYVEVKDKGPLGLFLKARRELAAEALLSLARIDPRDQVAIAEQQAIVKEYLSLVEWIKQGIDEAVEAEETIAREYGDADTND